jgi:hypothetical protein
MQINFKKLIVSVLMTILLNTSIFSNDSILISDIGSTAEYIAVGGNEAVSLGAHNIFNNPSMIGKERSKSLSLFTTTLMENVQFRSIAVSKQWKKLSLGLGYMDSVVSDIPETIEGSDTFEVSDYYGALFSVYKAGIAYECAPYITVGFAANYYFNKIYSVSGSTINGDIGLLYKRDRVMVSATSKNIFQTNQVEYDNDGLEALPLVSTLAAHIYLPYIEPMGQMRLYSGKESTYSFGALIHLPKFSYLDILVGYKTSYYLDELKERVSFGFGLNMFDLIVHYTYETSNSVAFNHNSYFSISYLF